MSRKLFIPALFSLAFVVCALAQQEMSEPSLAALQSAYFRGDFQNAEAGYRKLLLTDTANHHARAWLARAYLKQNKVADARQVLEHGGGSADGNPDFVTARGELLFREGLIGEAEREFLQATKLPTSSARAYLGAAEMAAFTSRIAEHALRIASLLGAGTRFQRFSVLLQ
jgi:Tfp pilus assembly protein PilF